MAESRQLLGLAGRVLAVLLVLSSCAGADTSLPARPLVERAAAPETPILVDPGLVDPVLVDPVLVDTDGAQLHDDHAGVVRAVHHALAAGDLDALSELYAGDDWAGQAELLADGTVRRNVLDALRTQPANLGEGYLYPGFSVDPTIGYLGYQTAFFLDYDPPRTEGGPLRWRGIALPEAPTA